jgi:hypothetical protein
MKNRISRHVNELQNAIILAGLNYDIWWLYKNKETRKKLVEPLTLFYPAFIATSMHAHFVSMVVASYRVFEKRRDTITLPNLIKLIEREGMVTQNDIYRFRTEIDKIKKVWSKIAILRNNMFGHRTNALDTKEIWIKANLTPDDVKSSIIDSKRLLNKITETRDNSGHLFSQSAYDDTKSLFEDLNSIDRGQL